MWSGSCAQIGAQLQSVLLYFALQLFASWPNGCSVHGGADVVDICCEVWRCVEGRSVIAMHVGARSEITCADLDLL